MELESGREFLATKNRRSRRCQELEFRVGVGEWWVRGQESGVRSLSWSSELELESGREFLATKNRRSRRCQELE